MGFRGTAPHIEMYSLFEDGGFFYVCHLSLRVCIKAQVQGQETGGTKTPPTPTGEVLQAF